MQITQKNLKTNADKVMNVYFKNSAIIKINNIQDFCLETPGVLQYIDLEKQDGTIESNVYACMVKTFNPQANIFSKDWYAVGYDSALVKSEKYSNKSANNYKIIRRSEIVF